MDARPLDSVLESICSEQFIDSTRRVAACQRYTKSSEPAAQFIGALNEAFSSCHGNMFGGFEY